MTTRDQLSVCGALTNYSPDEVEKLIAEVSFKAPELDDSGAYTVVLKAMRSDHKVRSVNEAKVSIGLGYYVPEPET